MCLDRLTSFYKYLSLLLLSLLLTPQISFAVPTYQLNYQGKLTNGANIAVPDGTYNMRFWLLTTPTIATTSALWSEELTDTYKVQVTNGLFSIMLGSTTPLTSVDFTQTLYLGVEIGGTSTPAWDGEMSPRKIIGAVPVAFEANNARTLDNIATSSFLRADQDDTASGLLTFTGGFISSASSTIESLTTTIATTTTLVINGESFSDFTGTSLTNTNGVLSVATSTFFTTSAQFAQWLSNETGNGAVVFDNGPTITSPTISCTGCITDTNVSDTLTASAVPLGGITGLGSNVATFLGTPSSANLISALTDETGSGSAVFSASPAFTGTPTFQNLYVTTTGTSTLGYASTTALTVTGNGFFSGALSFTGSAANIALGSNYLSGDGGDEGIYVDTSGNVGVGTTEPGAKLAVQNTSATATGLLLANDSGNTGDYQQIKFQFSQAGWWYGSAIRSRVTEGGANGGNLSFWTDTTGGTLTERMTIDRSGNVGIGTTSPTAKLSIQDDYNGLRPTLELVNGTTPAAGVGSRIRFADGSNNSMGWIDVAWEGAAITNSYMRFVNRGASSQEIMRITGGGNVGIGTTSPVGKLHLETNASDYLYVDDTLHNTRAVLGATSNGAQLYARDLNNNAAALIFTGASEYARFTSDGNFGIGTTSPEAKLQVSDGTNTSLIVGNQIDNSTQSSLVLQGKSAGGTALSSTWNLRTDGYLDLNTQAVNQLFRIDTTNGNVGVGTTNPTSLLQVGEFSGSATSTIAQGSNNGQTAMLMFGGASTQGFRIGSTRITSDYTFGIDRVIDGVSYNRLTLSGGNVGIGTTSPASKLEVGGITSGQRAFGVLDDGWGDIDNPMVYFDGGVSSDGNILKLRSLGTRTDAEIFDVENGNGTAFVIKGSGNVGIGTTTPNVSLFVNSGTPAAMALANSTLANSVFMRFVGADRANKWAAGMGIDAAADNYQLYSYTLGSPVLTATDGGNVGIGVTAPNYQFQVANATDATLSLLSTGNREWWVSAKKQASADADFKIGTGSTYNSTLLTIQPTGNVGIGTTTPSEKLEVNGKIKIDDGGSATVPSLKMYADTIGLSSPLGTDLAFITNGATAMEILSTGNVGIGTAGPGYKLEVNDNSTNWAARIYQANADGYGLVVNVNNEDTDKYILGAYSGGTYKMVVRNDGNVGIGTTTPSGKLDVSTDGAANFVYMDSFHSSPNNVLVSRSYRGSAASPAIVQDGDILWDMRAQGYDGTNGVANAALIRAAVDGTPGSGDMPGRLGFFTTPDGSTAVTERMRITSGGNVGIGNTSPGSKLEVGDGTAGASVVAEINGGTDATKGAGLTLSKGGAATGGLYSKSFVTGSGTSSDLFLFAETGNAIHFATNGGVTERLTIATSGNVGIGTTGPGAKLSVVSPDAVEGTGNEGLRLQSAATIVSGTKLLTFGTADTSNYAWIRAFDSGVAESNLVLQALGGNVGIGTTTPGNKLDVWGGAGTWVRSITSGSNNSAGFIVGSNNVNKWDIGVNQVITSDSLEFRAVGPGGVDDVMVMQQGGNVGIGVAAPSGKLHIAGADNQGIILESTTDAANAGSALTFYQNMQSDNSAAGRIKSYLENGEANTNKRAGILFQTKGTGSALGTLTDRMVILGDGNVGIGTTSPSEKLVVNGAARITGQALNFSLGDAGLDIDYSSSYGSARIVTVGGASGATPYDLALGTNGIDQLHIKESNGYIGIGTTSPTAQLSTTGSVRFSNFGAGTLQTDAAGNLSVSSDERLKDIEGTFVRGMDALRTIEPIQYYWKSASGFDTKTLYTGFSAQNIRGAIPEAVGEDRNGFLTLSDRPILATLINATKEQQLTLDDILAASSSATTLEEGETFWTRIAQLVNSFVDGVLEVAGVRAHEIQTDNLNSREVDSQEVTTKELCVGTTCVDEETFLQMVNDARGNNNTIDASPVTTAAEDALLDTTLGDGSTESTNDTTAPEQGDVLDQTELQAESSEAVVETVDTVEDGGGAPTQTDAAIDSTELSAGSV